MRVSRAVSLALLAVVALSLPAVAQRHRAFVGVSGGATLSNFVGGAVNTSSRWGGTAGVVMGWRGSTNTAFSLEVNWIQKGAASVRLDYIEIPFLVGGVVPFADRKGRARVYTGLGVGFKVGCSSTSATLTCDAARSPDWMWPIGLFLGSVSNTLLVGLDVRYEFGLNDAFDTSITNNGTWVFKLVLGKPLSRRG